MLSSPVTTARSRTRAVALLLAGLVLVGTGATAATGGPAVADSTGVLVPTTSASGPVTATGRTVPARTARQQWTPPADTVVGVSGSALDGFTISRYDGSTLSPPTDSEARAECGEYDRRVARVRCRVEVATWYRDLGDLKLSLRWARQQ
ncbi:hypothetical protein [Nocardioides sp. AX2bis]|uniref:hypothetical protein n=1 Tax=Nocardioides sp. AX2bis TaxID=2653157 RepID=UPI0012F237EC|nr:hypothetical protein [Nocardioides sp. AX2bis]VXC08193.1 exported hypothetical protein [Nocardioides sp. AX2bis]